MDVGVSDHFCSIFTVDFFFLVEQDNAGQTWRKRYLTAEVTANFIELLDDTPADFLPSSSDFMVDGFNNKLRTILVIVAPLKLKISANSTPP